MINKKQISRILCACATFTLLQLSSRATPLPTDTALNVPLGGNAWVSKSGQAVIDNAGLSNWSSNTDVVSVYVRLEAAGDLKIALRLQVPEGNSTIKVSAGQSVLTKTVSNHEIAIVDFGTAHIKAAGYLQIKLQGLKKSGKAFAQVSDLLVSGPATANGVEFTKDNHDNYFHWGRRGPSVHLNYPLPDEAKTTTEWFYNEVTVPVGNDVLGSYFMADGFTGGYFGMQVNSPTERHVLFSIWSPFNTDDPNSIPDSLKIHLLKKGAGVHGGEFGGEGSGGQSYMNYPWVAGKTYAFLIHAQADAATKTTIFTAYFKLADQSTWQLVASFKRPMSGFYLKGLYSFLENFDPEMGNTERRVNFGNGWLVDTNGKWYPLTKALFTGDATANIKYRKDYGGGVQGNHFYLRNCGFFNDFSTLRSDLTRQQSGTDHPVIDFSSIK